MINQFDAKRIYYVAMKLPNGELLESKNDQPLISYKDEQLGMYSIRDCRISYPTSADRPHIITIDSNDPHHIIREYYVPHNLALKDMSEEQLSALSDEDSELVKRELEFRQADRQESEQEQLHFDNGFKPANEEVIKQLKDGMI